MGKGVMPEGSQRGGREDEYPFWFSQDLQQFLTLLSRVIEIMHASCTLYYSKMVLNADSINDHLSNNCGMCL